MCVSKAGLGRYMGNTAKWMTSPAHMRRDSCVEVRLKNSSFHFQSNHKYFKMRHSSFKASEFLLRLFFFFFFQFQAEACVCQASVCARSAGQVTVAAVPPPKPAVNLQTACFAVAVESVCVASVCVLIPNDLETSVRDVLPAKSSENPPGI